MGDYPKRMYHPELAPPDNETDAHTPGQESVYRESGWLPAPGPVERPGYATEPVSYVRGDDGRWAPATAEPEAKPARARKKTSDETET